MNSSGSAMKNVAQCGYRRPVGGEGELALEAQHVHAPWGRAAGLAASPRCAARAALSPRSRDSQPQRPAPGASPHRPGAPPRPTLRPFAMGIWASSSLPRGPASPHLPTAGSLAARALSRRARRYSGSPSSSASDWRHRRVWKRVVVLTSHCGQEN